MIHAFPALEVFENFGFFIETVGGEKNGDRLSDHLFGGIAEYSLGGLVPTADDAIEVFADNRIVG